VITPDKKEILRYLGYRPEQDLEQSIEHSITQKIVEIQKIIQPRMIYKRFPLLWQTENTIEIADLVIKSENLARNLKDCASVYCMAATLGVGVDRLLTRAAAIRMSDTVIYQAIAAATIEEFCDEINEKIRREAAEQGLYCRPRFSPGYGDFSVQYQPDFARLLDAPRKIGLTVTDSCLLVPMKSVTAIIGLSITPQPCHKKGCESCDKTDCAFRR